MKKEISLPFYKKGGKWFALVEGKSEDDNEMVMGADIMLDHISNNDNYIELKLTTGVHVLDASLIKLTEMDEGCTYSFKRFENVIFDEEIWICDVTLFVFGEFPKTIKLERTTSDTRYREIVTNAIDNDLDVIAEFLEYKYTK